MTPRLKPRDLYAAFLRSLKSLWQWMKSEANHKETDQEWWDRQW